MPASNKQTTLWVADTLSWLLHFTRKFNLAIQSRFPDFRIIASSPLLIQRSYNGINERSLLCYSDRIAQDSHLIPSSENSINFVYFSALGTFILLSKAIITYALTKVKNFL